LTRESDPIPALLHASPENDPAAGISIEEIREPARLKEVEALQVQVWGGDASWVAPSHILYAVGASGGIVLGAYDGNRLVGFVFGLLGRQEGKLYHMSHMLGIHPHYQGKGIGELLKQQQRERALAQGLDLMTWTFDPLEARNAYFNLHKLGALSRSYKENIYGEMADELNRGMPSDRLLVEWHLRAQHPSIAAGRSFATGERTPILTNEAGSPVLQLDEWHRIILPPAGLLLTIAVPPNVQRLKKDDPEAALAWRLATRRAFIWAFERAYTACDFDHDVYLLAPRDIL
jgi:predicted GNAT superfamily acetyltransferase